MSDDAGFGCRKMRFHYSGAARSVYGAGVMLERDDGMEESEILVIGGGIAGISVGAALAERGRKVTVLERESQPGYHSTGRSAALYTENYGNPTIRALTRVTGRFLRSPPEGFIEAPILAPRGVILVARPDQSETYAKVLAEARATGANLAEISMAKAVALLPILNPDYASAALYEPHATDIDVHGLTMAYLRRLKGRGRLVTDAEARAIARTGTLWRVETRAGIFAAPILVNAAGAWAEEVAALAGLPPLGLTPLRRTALTFDLPSGPVPAHWPMGNDVAEDFYFKPEAGRMLASPADETPSPPCDAQPEDIDIAIAVDRIEQATTIKVTRIQRRWAGLRTFAPDRTTVSGFDPLAEGFYWQAGQGGYGIQTSYAMAEAAAGLIDKDALPAALADEGLRAADLSPARLRAG
jgi:D-arginine dehydrogenase